MAEARIHQQLTEVLERDLFQRHGPLIGHEHLWKALGYTSLDAFRQADSRKLLPVQVFQIEHRRGKFALVKDVAAWLADQYARTGPPVGAEPSEPLK